MLISCRLEETEQKEEVDNDRIVQRDIGKNGIHNGSMESFYGVSGLGYNLFDGLDCALDEWNHTLSLDPPWPNTHVSVLAFLDDHTASR